MGSSHRFPFVPARFTPLLAAAALALTLTAGNALAQIRINEIYPDPFPASDDGNERVEIYNAGTTAIDVTGWCIHDLATIDGNPTPERCRLPEDFDTSTGCSGSAIIQPGEFRLIKGRDAAAWANNSTGDDIYLCSNRTFPATVVHQVSYGNTFGFPDSVWAALPDGSGNFAWRGKTFCASNGGVTGDVTAPATVNDLAAVPGAYPGEIRLTWTSPGDDGNTGTATSYSFVVSHDPINSGNFGAAADLERYLNEPAPELAATPETLVVFGLDPDSTWYFALRTQDEVPNTSGVSNSPSTAPLAGNLPNPDLGYTPYFGNLHSHTSYSDGVQTPVQAYAFARNTAPTPLDFLAVTEHNHVSAGGSLANYNQLKVEAAAANDDGDFVAIFGQEWGVASEGHVNIFECPALLGWDGGQFNVFVAQGDYGSLYNAILANPPASSPPIGEFCHPATTDFASFAFTNEGKSVMHLIALVNGPATSPATDESDIGNTNFDSAFQLALFQGFRVSPTADQDNHQPTWGASSQSRTGVLAHARTKSEILNAMAARRTYATQDHNARVDFTADGEPMGAVLVRNQGIRIAARVTDPDLGESVTRIELFRGVTGVSTATLIAFNTGSPEFNWRELNTFPSGTEVHYYLRIRTSDNQTIWTGPVYVTYDDTAPLAVGDRPSGGLTLTAGPNPATARVQVAFTLPRPERATLAVYDLAGRRVHTLVERDLGAGEHRVAWDTTDMGTARSRAGVFFLRLETASGAVTRKILVLD